jgi:hypothetical protein
MAFDVMRTSALENPRDLRYEPYIRKLVERLLSYDNIKDKLVADFEFLFGEYFYLEHIYPISLIFWRALERLGAKGSMERIRREILSSNVGEWIKRAEDLGDLSNFDSHLCHLGDLFHFWEHKGRNNKHHRNNRHYGGLFGWIRFAKHKTCGG